MTVLFLGCVMTQADEPVRQTRSLDAGWKFNPGDAPGAEQPQFDDNAWRQINVPHDWSIEGPFAETNKTGGAGAFLPSGVGWYRKHFACRKVMRAAACLFEFDGVMANSDVWINGFHLGHRPYGYVSFQYELTGHFNFGAGRQCPRCPRRHSAQPASRWYSGRGHLPARAAGGHGAGSPRGKAACSSRRLQWQR